LFYISKASERFAGQPIIFMGDINIDLRTQTPTNRDTEIMALLSTLGLEDMSTQCQNALQIENTMYLLVESNIDQQDITA
jgi:hypothetical protein